MTPREDPDWPNGWWVVFCSCCRNVWLHKGEKPPACEGVGTLWVKPAAEIATE